MLVGIMSDSHGDAPVTARAVSLLENRGAKKLFHCGDLCGDHVLDELAGRDCVFVWGNCDAPSPVLRKYVTSLGLSWPEAPVHVTVAGKRIAVYHGHENGFFRAKLSPDPGLDYLFYGHSHRYADDRQNGCRLINPGALYRAAVHTVALLDVKADKLTFLQVDTGQELSVKSKRP
ncbi:MAG: YfcE family phosphodiesterase [Phycisphaerales bacterium]|nr:YfcE family phosphodiesterase [Phycisphaerales bacterium]